MLFYRLGFVGHRHLRCIGRCSGRLQAGRELPDSVYPCAGGMDEPDDFRHHGAAKRDCLDLADKDL